MNTEKGYILEKWKYYKDGELVKTENYKDGELIKIDEAIKSDHETLIKIVTPCVDGKKNGIQKIYCDDKLERESPYIDDVLNGEEIGYNIKSGKVSYITPYVNGLLHGISKSFRPNGIISCEVEFQNGIRDGLSKNYIFNKVLYIDEIRTYENDLLKQIRYYNANGPLTGVQRRNGYENVYKNGVHITSTDFYLNNNIRSIITFENDSLQRCNKTYDSNGKLIQITYWQNEDSKDCISIQFDEQGNPTEKIIQENLVTVEVIKYYPNTDKQIMRKRVRQPDNTWLITHYDLNGALIE